MRYHLFVLCLTLGSIFTQDCFKENVKLKGRLLTKEKIKKDSSEACLSLCESAAGCQGMVYYTVNSAKKWRRMRCYLLSKVNKRTKIQMDAVSATIKDCAQTSTGSPPVTEKPENGNCFKDNERIMGKPVNQDKIWTESPKECLSKCEETDGCLGMVYHTKFKRCLMFSKIAPITKQVDDVVSAIIANCEGTEAGSTSPAPGPSPVTEKAPGPSESVITIRQQWSQQPNGFDRKALVRQPTTSTPDQKVPVVICFHGNGGSANLGAWRTLWDTNLVVAAEGYERSWNIWKEKSKAPDVEFVEGLIKKVGDEFSNADMDNVVLVGTSNGAGFIHRLMIETKNPRPFHKVFPMASSLIQQQYHDGQFYMASNDDGPPEGNNYDTIVSPDSPGPNIYQFHGTEDGAVPYSGGTTFAAFLGAQDSMFYFAQAFGYTGNQLDDGDGEEVSSGVFKYSYLDGKVNHYKVVGASHGNVAKFAWPIVNDIINADIGTL